jgi:hypothetical protein
LAIWQTEIDGVLRSVDAPTGDYRMAVVMAAALADAKMPVYVKVWIENLLPEYGPYWYKIDNDEYVRLVVSRVTPIKDDK